MSFADDIESIGAARKRRLADLQAELEETKLATAEADRALAARYARSAQETAEPAHVSEPEDDEESYRPRSWLI